MRNLLLIAFVALISCCGSKKTTSSASVPLNQDSISAATASKPTPDTIVPVSNTTPACVDKLIASFKEEAVQNPPRKVFSYTYQGKTVYYVPAICCDFFSDLYDQNCSLIGHPDGGFTGKGDGKIIDFEKTRSNEKLIWADERKRN